MNMLYLCMYLCKYSLLLINILVHISEVETVDTTKIGRFKKNMA